MGRKTVWTLLCVMAASVLILLGYIVFDTGRTDTQSPVITMDTPEIEFSIQDSEAKLLQGVTAWDDADGDVTDALIIESIYGMTEDRSLTVTYAVADKSGNVSKMERIARCTDYHSPYFTLSGPLIFELGGAWDIMDVIGAEDVFEGNIQQRIKAAMITSGTTVAEEGTHGVQFQVTNSIGDTVQLVLPVEVYPAGSYDAQLSLTDYLSYVPVGTSLNVQDYLLEFETRYGKLNLSGGIPDGLHMQIAGTVDTRTPGVYPVTYTATYTYGDQTCIGYTKLLVVVEEQASV